MSHSPTETGYTNSAEQKPMEPASVNRYESMRGEVKERVAELPGTYGME